VLFLGEPSESEMEEYGESQDSSKFDGELILGPNGESLHSQVMPFTPPTEVSMDALNQSLLNDDFEDTGYSICITSLGDGKLRATIPTARIGEYAGSADTIEFVGIWYDLQKFKNEAAEERRREQELDNKHESHPKKTDGLKP
jgi:hypothetical protein